MPTPPVLSTEQTSHSTHWAAGRLPSWPRNRVARTGSAQHQEGYAHPAPDPRSERAGTLGSAAGWGSSWRARPALRPLGPGAQPGSWWEQEPGQVSDGCCQTTRGPSSADAQELRGAGEGLPVTPANTVTQSHSGNRPVTRCPTGWEVTASSPQASPLSIDVQTRPWPPPWFPFLCPE